MPILEYKCPSGHVTEKIFQTRRLADKAMKTIVCPTKETTCHKMAKLVEFPVTAAPAFKGSGWTPKSTQGARTDVPEHLL
jgi:hypothetical protein